MTSLLKRTAVLSFSRFANQAILLLSPLLLVRILTVVEYGTYQEFLAYVGLISPMVSFAVARSLPYLIPKFPSEERTWVSQTVLLVLVSSGFMLLVTTLGEDLLARVISFNFILELQLYVIFFVNMDFVELYFLAKKRTDVVFYYSTGRLFARTTVILASAYLTEDVRLIIHSLILIEALRCLGVFGFGLHRRWFTSRLSPRTLATQMTYFVPLGVGALIETMNLSAGRIFTAFLAGPHALAQFTVGMFAVKIVDVLRGSIADVIFPDIVEINAVAPRDALPLWKRATVWYALLMFPFATLFCIYSDVIVTVLFTSEYAESVAIFSLFALQFFPLCFDFHLPIRVQNANRYFVVGTSIALVINLGLLYPMFSIFGLPGVVVAAIVARWASTVYLGYQVLHIYRINIRELAQWNDLSRILIAAIAGIPLLIVGDVLVENLVVRGVIFGSAYFVVYAVALKLLKVSEYSYFIARIAYLDPVSRLRRFH